MKIVLDTNVLISGIFWKGTPRQIVSLWAKNKIQLLITNQIFNEYLRVSKEIDKKGIATNKLAIRIIKNSIMVPNKELTVICRDPDDNKFLKSTKKRTFRKQSLYIQFHYFKSFLSCGFCR